MAAAVLAGGSGVARNFRQGVRQSVAFLSVYSRSAALPSQPYNQNVIAHIVCRIRLESIYFILFIMKFVQLGTQIKARYEKKKIYKIHKKYIMKYIKTI